MRNYGGTSLLTSDWQPTPEFRIADGDLTVGFLAANNVMYLGPVFDPMFSAYVTGGCQYGDCAYLPDNYFTTVACIDRMRVCDPQHLDRCSRLVGSKMVYPGTLGLNRIQEATAERVLEARFHSIMWDAIAEQGGKALMANDVVVDFVSTALPPNQWVIETERWFQTLLANVQYRVVDFTNNAWMAKWPSLPPPSDPSNWLNGSSSAMEDLCERQLIRNTGQYQSFSLAGVLIVTILSISIIIASWFLEGCVLRGKGRRHDNRKRYKRVAYAADGKLQLLRVALQSAGYYGWHGRLDDVPYRSLENMSQQRDIEPAVEEDERDAESSSMPLQPMNPEASHTPQENYSYSSQANVGADERMYPRQDPVRRPSPASFYSSATDPYSSPPMANDIYSSPPMVNDDHIPLFQRSNQYHHHHLS